MKRKRQKGFTIVELMGVIAILGVIATIAVVGVNSVMKSMKLNYYKTQSDLIIVAGKDYYSVHREQLPKDIGGSSTIPIQDLVKEGYLDPLYDYNKKACEMKDPEDNYVKATLSAKGDYHYSINLNCEGSDMNIDLDRTPPEADILVKDIVGEETKKDNVVLTAKDDESNLCSVYYEVRSNGAIYSEGQLLTEVVKSITHSLEIKEYPDGKYTVVLFATDCSGNSTHKEKEFEIDTVAPMIGAMEYRKVDQNGQVIQARATKDENIIWYKDNIYATIKDVGQDTGSGIDYSSYDILKDGKTYLKNQKKDTILSEAGEYQITLNTYDKAGNKVSKVEYLNIDNTPIHVVAKDDLNYVMDSEDYQSTLIKDIYDIISKHPSGIDGVCKYQGKEITKVSEIKTAGIMEVFCTFKTGSGISKDISIKVRIIEHTQDFPYQDEEYIYPIYVSGYYTLEGWGASGATTVGKAGNGGFISGTIYLNKGDMLIIRTGNTGGGGTGYNGANGGKSTVFLVNGKQVLVAAGGGGGNNGGAGGSGTGKGGLSAGYGPGGDGTNGSGGGESAGEKYYDSCISGNRNECVGGEVCSSPPCELVTPGYCETIDTSCIDISTGETYSCPTDHCYSDEYDCPDEECDWDDCAYHENTCVGGYINNPGLPGDGGSSILDKSMTLLTKTDGVETGHGHGRITYVRKK